MATQTADPQDRPEIQTADDLLSAIRTGMAIATRADISQSELRVVERINERFDAQNRWIDARFDAQNRWIDARFDAQDRRTDERFDAQDARFDAQDRRTDERFEAQNRWIGERFDAQDARMDSQDAQTDAFRAQLNENTAAIREMRASAEAERRSKGRTIQWLSVAFGALGVIATLFAAVVTLFGN